MKKSRILVFTIILVLIGTLLLSCSSGSKEDSLHRGDEVSSLYPSADDKYDYGYGNDYEKVEEETGKPIEEPSKDIDSAGQADKIIKTVNIDAETKDFDSALKGLEDSVSSLGGYIETSNVSGKSYNYRGDRYSRIASYTIRIPAEKLDTFTGEVGTLFNITSSYGNVNNVSAEYYDIVSRLETLEAEKAALTDMYKKSDTIDYMLKVQERLYNVIEEIESHTARLKYLDGKVSYSTVTINITEVIEYTEPPVEPITWGERLGTAFVESWKEFADNFKSFSVGFVYAIPTLIILALFAGLAAVLVLLIVRKSKKKNNTDGKDE